MSTAWLDLADEEEEEGADDVLANANFDEIDEDLARFQQDGIVRESLSKGIDLKGYGRQIDQELNEVEFASITEYMAQADNVASLHAQIQTCDSVLESMQKLLHGFQADLGGISEDIKHLQQESSKMSTKLRNRKSTEASLAVFLEAVALPESLIVGIVQGEVNEQYLELLNTLSAKIASATSTVSVIKGGAAPAPAAPAGAAAATADGTSAAASAAAAGSSSSSASPTTVDLGIPVAQTLAAQNVQPELERLRLKAVSRVREFLVNQISMLKRPRTNVQLLQQNLLKFKAAQTFLVGNAPAVALEVRAAYVDAMGKTLAGVFKSYHVELLKLLAPQLDKASLIAAEEATVPGAGAAAAAAGAGAGRGVAGASSPLALASRADILDEPDAPPLLVLTSQAQHSRVGYEAVFRSEQKHLIDAATAEFAFSLEFFSVRSRDLFLQIFSRVLAQCLETLEAYLASSFDAIGILLMIRLTHAHRLAMERRRVPCLDAYFDRVNMLLWPRFKAVFDLHLASVSRPRRLAISDTAPHVITRRYVDFAAAVLQLHGNFQAAGMSDDMVLHKLALLRSEVEKLLLRAAHELPPPRPQMIFLINNYFLAMNGFAERQLECPDRARFRELLEVQTSHFVEDTLMNDGFGRMILFLRQAEGAVAAGGAAAPAAPAPFDAAACEAIVRDFAGSWKAGLERINSSLARQVAHPQNAMDTLKQVATQLLMYYTRFQAVIKAGFPRGPPFAKDIVSVQTILNEIKVFSRSTSVDA